MALASGSGSHQCCQVTPGALPSAGMGAGSHTEPCCLLLPSKDLRFIFQWHSLRQSWMPTSAPPCLYCRCWYSAAGP